MKKFFLVAVALIAAVAANAQIVTSRSSITNVTPSDNYSRWYIGWNTMSFDKVEGSFNGITLGGIKGIGITEYPLFVETGTEVAWTHYSYEEGRYETSDELISVAIPLHLTYKLDLGDNASLMPFTGPNFRFNVYDDNLDTDHYNLFQFGWNFGVGVTYGKLYLGYKGTANFTSYHDGADTNGFYQTISLGYQF